MWKRNDATLDEANVTAAMNLLDAIWAQMFPAEQMRMIKLMVEKVIASPKRLEVRLRANGIERLILDMRTSPTIAHTDIMVTSRLAVNPCFRMCNARLQWHFSRQHAYERISSFFASALPLVRACLLHRHWPLVQVKGWP